MTRISFRDIIKMFERNGSGLRQPVKAGGQMGEKYDTYSESK